MLAAIVILLTAPFKVRRVFGLRTLTSSRIGGQRGVPRLRHVLTGAVMPRVVLQDA